MQKILNDHISMLTRSDKNVDTSLHFQLKRYLQDAQEIRNEPWFADILKEPDKAGVDVKYGVGYGLEKLRHISHSFSIEKDGALIITMAHRGSEWVNMSRKLLVR